MFIIDKDGKVIEGQELTTEEVDILKQLTGDEENSIRGFSTGYVNDSDRRRIARGLIENFRISRRPVAPVADVQFPEEAPTYIYPEPIPAPAPVAVAVEDDNPLF